MAKKAIVGLLAGGSAAAAMAAVLVFAAPASVAAGQDRPAYCDRIDKVLPKRQAVVTRLEGDANTKGSIAWLNARAAAASSAGNAERAKLFTDRAALRSQLLDPLKTVTADLVAVQQAHCN